MLRGRRLYEQKNIFIDSANSDDSAIGSNEYARATWLYDDEFNMGGATKLSGALAALTCTEAELSCRSPSAQSVALPNEDKLGETLDAELADIGEAELANINMEWIKDVDATEAPKNEDCDTTQDNLLAEPKLPDAIVKVVSPQRAKSMRIAKLLGLSAQSPESLNQNENVSKSFYNIFGLFNKPDRPASTMRYPDGIVMPVCDLTQPQYRSTSRRRSVNCSRKRNYQSTHRSDRRQCSTQNTRTREEMMQGAADEGSRTDSMDRGERKSSRGVKKNPMPNVSVHLTNSVRFM